MMNDDGSNRVKLTSDPKHEYSPRWSPDGTKIVFIREGDLYIMGADGSNPLLIVAGGGSAFAVNSIKTPNWSPDGKFLFYCG